MTLLRCQVNLRSKSLVAEDDIINTWHFVTVGETSVQDGATECWNLLDDFYQAIKGYLSSTLDPAQGLVKVYDMEDPEPRAPVYENALSALANTTTTLPREVALCLSFQAVKASGVNQARRRGRVYLGPFTDATANDSTGRPGTGLTGAVRTAADALVTASKASAVVKWVVWSPTEQVSVVVDNGWVDDEWDTQRSRGLQAVNRYVFS